ncbi:MAG: 4-(cytidine 5'-diphospho)-2-C-methyl-D-erythritol kinase [Fervidobacterium sp.]
MGKSCRIVLRTYAKLNLCLDVLNKRPDGYHDIDSLFQNISLFDEMEVLFVDGTGRIFIESNVQIEDNIIEKAWKKVCFSKKDVFVKLKKNIPIGGGLGGGSSNAAGFIVALEKTGILDKNDTENIAAMVGSDVLFFIHGGSAIVNGRGEIIKSVEPLRNFRVNLYFPNFSVSTKQAYEKLKPEWFGKAPMKSTQLYEAYRLNDFEMIKNGSYNIFEKVIPKVVFEKIKELRKHYPAALTGSGSTYFSVNEEGKFSFVEKGVEIYAFEKG